ncbi:RdRP-domain-containing protein [Auriculariales sp. MPI-PUGE-AT-0066]|nr:RdRP-domain-containing protein [Auriculariales sp. MPI-PUGE-AT-0066]
MCLTSRSPSPIPDEDSQHDKQRLKEWSSTAVQDQLKHDLLPHLDENGKALAVVRQPSLPPAKIPFRFRPSPATIVKVNNLPRYATREDVMVAVAEVLHTSLSESPPSVFKKTIGLVNFDVLMEMQYSTAQNKGHAFILLPFAFFGHRLQTTRVLMEGKPLEFRPVPGFELTSSKRLLLQKTPYQDPKIRLAYVEKISALTQYALRLRQIQLGTLQKNPHRCFVAEWSKDIVEQIGSFRFDPSKQTFRVSYEGHDILTRHIIAVKIASVKKIYRGWEYGNPFFVFLLEWTPAFEEEAAGQRFADVPKRDLEDIRERLTCLDDSHYPSAPYAFALRITPQDDTDIDGLLQQFRQAGLPIPEDTSSQGQRETAAQYQLRQIQFVSKRIYTTAVLDRFRRWVSAKEFVLAFQLELLVRNSIVDPATILQLADRIEKELSDKQTASERSDIVRQWAALIREHGAPKGVILSDQKRLIELLHRAKEENEKLLSKAALRREKAGKQKKVTWLGNELLPRIFDSSAFLCHHITITPTAIHLEGPFPVLSNRVLRRYPHHPDHFVRVHFTDEEHHQYRWDRETNGHAFVNSYVGGILKNGFMVAGRHFEFLAYSFGALKEHTVWFVTPFSIAAAGTSMPVTVNAQVIREKLGRFDKVINSPSLYGARLSQAFSATYPSLAIELDEIRHIDEVMDNDSQVNVLSDGCAPCSSQLAKEILEKLYTTKRLPDVGDEDYDPTQFVPKAFQIRIGGSKGMIYVDPTLKGRVLCLRPSMNKFDAPDSLDIEIANIPRASTMYLNRPLVMVLEDLNVHLSTFMTLQQNVMDETLQSTNNVGRFRMLLAQLKIGQRFNVHYVLGALKDLSFGFRDDCTPDSPLLLDDYWFYGMIQSATWVVFRQIKYQARIRVPDSWTLVGVLDEHKMLGSGEVMVHIQDEDHPYGYFLKGPIMICRSPVVHPGDVQIVTAVVPEDGSPLDIEKLSNCVVFSAQGKSIASCLGGGDLDGDLFHVSEYKKFIEQVQANKFRPADYTPGEKKKIDRDCTIADVADFVTEYINSDVLGLVSTTHLVIADQNMDGVGCGKCMQLAALHSQAVDYAKTGVPVPHRSIPHYEFPAKPDWKADEVADASAGDFYQSTRALGNLYRRVKAADIDELEIPRPTRSTREVELAITDELLISVQEWVKEIPDPTQEDLTSIEMLYEQYKFELKRMTTLHALHETKPLTEMEVMMGTITQKSSQQKLRKQLQARMHIHTSQLVGSVLNALLPNEENVENLNDALLRVWYTWCWVTERPYEREDYPAHVGEADKRKEFGARSFGMIVLAAIFKIMDRLTKRPTDVEAVSGDLEMVEDFEVALE